MERPKCQVTNCENNALIAYGSKWVCGKCYIKLAEKEKEKKNKEVEDLVV